MTPIRYLTEQEMEKVLSLFWIDDPFYTCNKFIVIFCLNTVLRVSELTGFDVGDVFNGHVKKELRMRKKASKETRERTLPMNETARKATRELFNFGSLDNSVFWTKIWVGGLLVFSDLI